MTTVASLTIEMAANVARLQADMARAANTVQSATAKMQKAAETAGRALGAIGAGLTVAAFTGFIRGAINAADETSKLSQKIGVTVKDVAGLQLAFRQAGVSQEAMATGLARLSKGIAEGNDGLKSLGIATKNNDGTLKTSRQVLAEVADQFAKTGDGATKTARAQEIFGKTGADLIPLLNAGSKALDEYDALASKLGLTLSDETAKQAEAFNDTLDLVGQGVQGVGRQIAGQLLPTLTGLASEFFNTVSSGDNLKKTADFLAAALKGLYSAGVIGVEIFSSLGKTLGGVAAAVVAAVSGNFKQAGTIIGELQSDVGSGWKDALAQVDRAWNTTGDNTVANLAQINKAQMTSTKSLEDGKKAAQEYAKFLDQMRGKVAELSGVNADYIKQLVEFDKARKANVITEVQYIALVEQLIAKQPSSIKLVKELAEAEKARIAAINESYAAELQRAEALEGTVEGLVEQNAALKNEIELIGLTERAQLAFLQARNETIILTKEATLAELERASAVTGTQTRIEIALQEEIRLLRERGELLGQKLDRTEAAKSYENLQAEGKRFVEDLERGLTDSLFRAFEAGKGFFSTLWNGIKNLFKTTVLKLVIQGVVGSVLGAVGLSSAAQTVASTGGSGLSALSNLGSLASTASGFGAAFGTSFGANLSAAFSSGFSTLGLSLEAGFASIAQGTVTGIASGLGSLAAVAAPAAAALVVANALGFFRSNKTVGYGLAGTLGAGDINDYALNRRGGTLFSGPSYSVQDRGVAAQSQALQDAYGVIRTTVAGMAEQLGLGSDAIKTFTVRLGNDLIHPDTGGYGIKLDGLTAEQADQKILEALVAANEELAKFALGTTEYTRQNETAVQTLSRLTGSLQAVNTVFKTLGLTLTDASLAGADAASKFIDSFGGADQFAQVASSYYQNFYTEAERTANTVEGLRQRFYELGTAGATTREGFRTLVEEQQRLHGATSPVVAELLKLESTFASVVPAIDAVTQAAAQQAEQAQQQAAAIASERGDRLRIERETAQAAKAAAEEVAKLNEQNFRLAISAGSIGKAVAASVQTGPRFADYQGPSGFNAAGYNAANIAAQQRSYQQVLADTQRQNPFEVADYFGVISELQRNIASLTDNLNSGEFNGGSSSIEQAAQQAFGGFLNPEQIQAAADGLTSFSNVLSLVSGTAAQGAIGADQALRVLEGAYTGTTRQSVEYARGLEIIGQSVGVATGNLQDIQAAIQSGLDYFNSGEYYQAIAQEQLRVQVQFTSRAFTALTQRAASFNVETGNLETSFDVLDGFIGRLKSVQDAFANAAGDRAAEAGLISDAARRISEIITTPVAEAARNALADLPSFAGLDDGKLRDLSLLLKDLGQFDNAGLEKTFIRVSEALASGTVTGEQYAALIEYTESVYLGTATALNAVAEAGAAAADILREREGLELRILQLQGNTAELRRRELEALDPSNRAFQQFIYLLEDQARLEADAALLADAFGSIRDSVRDLIDGLVIDSQRSILSPSQILGEAERQYRMNLAGAFEGDTQAAGQLGGSVNALLEAARNNATSEVDYNRTFGRTVGDLQGLESFAGQRATTDDVVAELRAVRAELAEVNKELDAQRAELRAGMAQIASNTGKTKDQLQGWTVNGLPATET